MERLAERLREGMDSELAQNEMMTKAERRALMAKDDEAQRRKDDADARIKARRTEQEKSKAYQEPRDVQSNLIRGLTQSNEVRRKMSAMANGITGFTDFLKTMRGRPTSVIRPVVTSLIAQSRVCGERNTPLFGKMLAKPYSEADTRERLLEEERAGGDAMATQIVRFCQLDCNGTKEHQLCAAECQLWGLWTISEIPEGFFDDCDVGWTREALTNLILSWDLLSEEEIAHAIASLIQLFAWPVSADAYQRLIDSEGAIVLRDLLLGTFVPADAYPGWAHMEEWCKIIVNAAHQMNMINRVPGECHIRARALVRDLNEKSLRLEIKKGVLHVEFVGPDVGSTTWMEYQCLSSFIGFASLDGGDVDNPTDLMRDADGVEEDEKHSVASDLSTADHKMSLSGARMPEISEADRRTDREAAAAAGVDPIQRSREEKKAGAHSPSSDDGPSGPEIRQFEGDDRSQAAEPASGQSGCLGKWAQGWKTAQQVGSGMSEFLSGRLGAPVAAGATAYVLMSGAVSTEALAAAAVAVGTYFTLSRSETDAMPPENVVGRPVSDRLRAAGFMTPGPGLGTRQIPPGSGILGGGRGLGFPTPGSPGFSRQGTSGPGPGLGGGQGPGPGTGTAPRGLQSPYASAGKQDRRNTIATIIEDWVEQEKWDHEIPDQTLYDLAMWIWKIEGRNARSLLPAREVALQAIERFEDLELNEAVDLIKEIRKLFPT